MSTYTAAVRDYAHTTPLKTGQRGIRNCSLEFPEIDPIHRAFAPMVRELKFDVAEMAIATYLQAWEQGKGISLLPIVMSGRLHHNTLARLPDGDIRRPADLVGRRVGVRAYSQTTGLWVRGVLKEDHGVEADQITWVTTEGPHVEEYAEPPNVERTSSTLKDLLHSGDIAAVVGGNGLVPVIQDWEVTEKAWFERHGTVPINHMLTVRTDLLKSEPEVVRGIHDAFTASIDDTRTDTPRSVREGAVTHGLNDTLLAGVRLAIQYAREQELIRSEVTVEDLFADYRNFIGR
ncbi:ABC transporter substrate-binding protein [Streptomyces sp. NPDC057757]|uniref:ABC transporter substrate-binding protein n=1 Tax=Streptomyces sp. NPDC057757 TaxID=3346241 RepID=UPI0036B0CADC